MALIDNIYSYYMLDEAAGSGTADNAEGTALRDGTNANITCGSAGVINTSYLSDGTGDWSTFDHAAYPSTFWDDDFSISFWIYPTSIASGDQYVFWFGQRDGMIFCTEQKISIKFWTGVAAVGVTWNANLSNNTWYHVVFTRSKTTGFAVYVDNGIPQTDPATDNGAPADQDPRLWDRDGQTDYDFHGKLDEIGVWTKILSADEVSQLYNGGSGFPYPFTTSIVNYKSDGSFDTYVTKYKTGGAFVEKTMKVKSGGAF
jgi:hypothetical protein